MLNFWFEKYVLGGKNRQCFSNFRNKSVENLPNFENEDREKNANLVDLEKCCKMRLCSLS